MSFCGADFGKFEYFHFNFDIYDQIALDFTSSLCDFFEVDGSKVKNVIDEIEQVILKNSNKEKETDDSDYSNEEFKDTAVVNTNEEILQMNGFFFLYIYYYIYIIKS